MKLSLWPGIIILSFSSINIFSQSRLPQPTPTPSRVIVTNNLPAPTRIVQPTPLPIPVVVGRPRVVGDEEDRTPDQDINEKPVRTQIQPTEFRTMSFGQIKNKIAEAKRVMQSKPLQTASQDPAVATSLVRIAFYD